MTGGGSATLYLTTGETDARLLPHHGLSDSARTKGRGRGLIGQMVHIQATCR